MNSRLLILLFIFISCSTSRKTNISDLEYPIVDRYGIDLISSDSLAANIAEIIWTEKYINDDIQLYKPFEVKLSDNGKIWIVIANNPNKSTVIKRTYHMHINKNTGEILRNWVEK